MGTEMGEKMSVGKYPFNFTNSLKNYYVFRVLLKFSFLVGLIESNFHLI